MQPAYYRNFYRSSFAQPLPEAQRLEAMNAKINANVMVLYCTLALILTRTVVFAGKIKITLICNFARARNVLLARARARAKYELALT